MMMLLAKVVTNVNLKTLTTLAKRLILLKGILLQIDTLPFLKFKRIHVKMEDQ